jgi:hypothetical protein
MPVSLMAKSKTSLAAPSCILVPSVIMQVANLELSE